RGARIIATPGEAAPKPEAQVEEPPSPVEEAAEAAGEAAPEEPAEAAPAEEPVARKHVDAEALAEAEAPAEEPAKKAEEAAEAAPEKAGQEAEEAKKPARDKKPKKKAKKKEEPESGPQVRVISMPDPAEVARIQAEAELAKEGMPDPSGRAPRPASPGTPGTPPAAQRKGSGRKKDRRVVDFSQSLSEEEDRRRASLQAKKKKSQPVRDKTGGKTRPRRGRRPQFDAEHAHSSTMAEQASQPLKQAKRKLRIDEAIRVSDMAHQMGVKAQSVIKVLLGLGVMATINQSLDLDTASLVASEFGYEVEKVGFSEDAYIAPREEDAPESLKGRPPVVTIMGHVDHGKTSLLDAIRESNITGGEAGGITQHIGAYHVPTPRGEVVFLDTPGHEAFTAMRARGAQVTDIVVLVVAADDGVMDQTREAVNHSRAAGVPIVVAVNKMDKEGADPDRVKRELADMGLLPEDWGGETIYAHVSAKQHTGLDELLEMIILQSEVLELKANPDKPARGHIVEARLDKGRGAVATVLVQEGTLRQGDPFVCGLFSGRVRAMFNDQGDKVDEASPAMPVEVQGFEGVPEAGDEFVGVEDDKVARRIAESRQLKQREKDLAKESKITLETFLAQKAEGEAQILNLVIKSDVQGSLEAVSEALAKLSTDEVKVHVIHGGTGAITESDIMLASASKAVIIGFNVRPSAKVKDVAEQEKVDIRFYDIIYKLVSDIKDALSGMLAPEVREVYLGQAEVRDTFSVPKVGMVAGCAVMDGKITRNAGIRLLRDGVVTYTGTVSSLKRFKDDVKEVMKGYECGIGLTNFNDIKVGDVIEAFEEVEEARTLD
ncbi:MAG: translation initiation factor IF-2, partial [Oceanidesulfovibrio sp.]